ncbi:TonB-dependent siderophore receptor [Janthinobacterium sp. SUN118]|uniref:TonB-dependent siderophore receptor n=1 Tax=Janthinobacterium sp. SUN118 TaxID=3004100 RepID=UPI0025B1AAC2|nr:TonB-dependent siderophore receptor [Janthinobacterium sp. SUN118]MDN2709627.1 TonB-dependent siderophore receptor [Janthinobacterium sp. SUN118]
MSAVKKRGARRMALLSAFSAFSAAGAAWAQQDEVTLKEVVVSGSADESSGNPRVRVGSKLPLAMREIAQSVSVVTRDQIEQQNLLTLSDALRHAPGVTVENKDANRAIFYARGYEINSVQLDGVPTTYDFRVSASSDLALFERVEVLKGPAALYAGTSGTGGSINLVRKRPTSELRATAELSLGSWNKRRAEFDVGAALNAEGTLRGRVVGVLQDKDFFYDYAHERSHTLYGVADYAFSPATRLTVGASTQYVRAAEQPWNYPAMLDLSSGKPVLSLPDVPRKTNIGANFNLDQYRTTNAFAELEHKMANDWSGRLSANWQESGLDRIQAYPWNPIDPADKLVQLYVGGGKDRQRQYGVDLNAGGPFALFGRRHQLLVGANYNSMRFASPYYRGEFDEKVDIFQPRHDFPRPDFLPLGEGQNLRSEQYGVYTNARFSLTDPLTLVLGARASWWKGRTQDYTPDSSVESRNEATGKISPQLGLIYDLSRDYSLYASYVDVFQPQAFAGRDGRPLNPLKGKQYELGVKGESADRALSGSLALFRVSESGRAQSVLVPGGVDYYIARGKTRNQGLEAQVNGRLQPGWDVYGGYTYINSHELESLDGLDSSAFSAIAPRHMLRFGSNYAFAGDWRRFSVGGGVTAVSRFYNSFAVLGGAQLAQGGYATVDAHAAWAINARATLALNVSNLFDRHYYQRINTPQNGNVIGEPRALAVTLRLKL